MNVENRLLLLGSHIYTTEQTNTDKVNLETPIKLKHIEPLFFSTANFPTHQNSRAAAAR